MSGDNGEGLHGAGDEDDVDAEVSSTRLLWVDLVLLKVAGFVIIGIGCGWLVAGSLFGLGIAAFGIDVVARPTARRLPRAGALVELVLQRWRVP